MATAILDRLLHHTTVINIKGESCRLNEKTSGRPAGHETRTEATLGDIDRTGQHCPLRPRQGRGRPSRTWLAPR